MESSLPRSVPPSAARSEEGAGLDGAFAGGLPEPRRFSSLGSTRGGGLEELGRAPEGSSPREQEELGLNQDGVVSRQKSEGERLRE